MVYLSKSYILITVSNIIIIVLRKCKLCQIELQFALKLMITR